MPENVHCPMCDDGVAVRGEGRLEQSGDTYLPTTVWTCRCCGYARYEPALGTHWRAEAEPGTTAWMLPENLAAHLVP